MQLGSVWFVAYRCFRLLGRTFHIRFTNLLTPNLMRSSIETYNLGFSGCNMMQPFLIYSAIISASVGTFGCETLNFSVLLPGVLLHISIRKVVPENSAEGWWNPPALHQTFMDHRASEATWRCQRDLGDQIESDCFFLVPFYGTFFKSLFGVPFFWGYPYYFWDTNGHWLTFAWNFCVFILVVPCFVSQRLSTAGSGCASAYHAFVGPGDSTSSHGLVEGKPTENKIPSGYLT